MTDNIVFVEYFILNFTHNKFKQPVFPKMAACIRCSQMPRPYGPGAQFILAPWYETGWTRRDTTCSHRVKVTTRFSRSNFPLGFQHFTTEYCCVLRPSQFYYKVKSTDWVANMFCASPPIRGRRGLLLPKLPLPGCIMAWAESSAVKYHKDYSSMGQIWPVGHRLSTPKLNTTHATY